MSASEILKLIETVSPDDDKTLSEINARARQYLEPETEIVKMDDGLWYIKRYSRGLNATVYTIEDRYTTSRNALKEIRPNGFYFQLIESMSDGYRAALTDKITDKTQVFKPEYLLGSPYLPTEELAELHAIIQAIEYERNKDNDQL